MVSALLCLSNAVFLETFVYIYLFTLLADKKTGSDVHIDEIEQKMPLAKLIPIVTRQSSHIFKAGENEFLKTLFAVESIGSFSANIYESFSLE